MSVMIGIDPHKGSHTAVVINPDEMVIDEIRVKATANQLARAPGVGVGASGPVLGGGVGPGVGLFGVPTARRCW